MNVRWQQVSVLAGKRILLIIGGGISAYKSLELIRRLSESGASVTPILTYAGEEFVTPLSVSALAGQKVHRTLFHYDDEVEMGHIQLSRASDLIVVAPATADLMAKMAAGMANDLATTVILATDTPVLLAPAMNVRMWAHPATRRNHATLIDDGIECVGPNDGDMACGEYGCGRMAEPTEIIAAIERRFSDRRLTGRRIVVTSGSTHESIDPVRYIANRSSGAQGSAIATELARRGADVVFITGPAAVLPQGKVERIEVETAREMAIAVDRALPSDVGIFVAAVADWRLTSVANSKIKKHAGQVPVLELTENPDILKTVSRKEKDRPRLIVGFAAETANIEMNARKKLEQKGCDWIIANDVSSEVGVMGGSRNKVIFMSSTETEYWPCMEKTAVARRLVDRIATALDD